MTQKSLKKKLRQFGSSKGKKTKNKFKKHPILANSSESELEVENVNKPKKLNIVMPDRNRNISSSDENENKEAGPQNTKKKHLLNEKESERNKKNRKKERKAS